ncbi:MAG: hypothetical protein HY775_08365 [Acidobacteria bacterium]|nr:hypothetical protein [Acidobacteriota bacterium]
MKRIVLALLALSVVATACGGGKTTVAGGSKGKYCDLARTIDQKLGKSDPSQMATPEKMRAFFEEADRAIGAAVAAAPSEIKADIQTLAAAFRKVVDALRKANWDLMKVAADMASLSSPEIEAASKRVEKYGQDVCGITPEPTPSTAPPAGMPTDFPTNFPTNFPTAPPTQ